MTAHEKFLEFIEAGHGRGAEIARACGVSQAYISRLKKRFHRPSPEVAACAAKAMERAGYFVDDLERIRFELAFRNMPIESTRGAVRRAS